MQLTCQYLTGAGVRCNWSALPAETTARILRSTPGGSVGRVFFPPVGTDAYLDTTARTGTYGYAVQAVGADGQVAAQSDLVTITVP